MSEDYRSLAPDLPVPEDDGAADHLPSLRMPAVRLPSTLGGEVDAGPELARALSLPTFEAGRLTLYKRVTLVAREGAIEHAFYPVFPPEENAAEVLGRLAGAP